MTFYKRMRFVDDLTKEHGEQVLKLSVVTDTEKVEAFVQELREEFGERLLPALVAMELLIFCNRKSIRPQPFNSWKNAGA
ncbi:MAG: hypothetical protein ACLRSL_01360 [Streptococcus sp.]